jgi:hypothetical protein
MAATQDRIVRAAADRSAPEYPGGETVRPGRPNRTRYSRCTGSAATRGRGLHRNRSHGGIGRGGRNVCKAWLRVRCALGGNPRAAAVPCHADSVERALTQQPPRARRIRDAPGDRQQHHRRDDRQCRSSGSGVTMCPIPKLTGAGLRPVTRSTAYPRSQRMRWDLSSVREGDPLWTLNGPAVQTRPAPHRTA